MNIPGLGLFCNRALLAASAGGIAAAAVALPKPALALDFVFFFNESYPYQILSTDPSFQPVYEVEGFVFGLEGQGVQQLPGSVQINANSWDPLSVGTYHHMEGEGFEVVDGEITQVSWSGMLDSPDTYRKLVFSTSLWSMWANVETDPPAPELPIHGICACMTMVNTLSQGSIPVFVALDTVPYVRTTGDSIATTATPGPLPVLGAVAAFQASRKLRRRLQQTRSQTVG
jgi:hypothetical protein